LTQANRKKEGAGMNNQTKEEGGENQERDSLYGNRCARLT